MLMGASSPVPFDVVRLKADLEALRGRNAALRETFARNRHASARARREASRIRLISARLRDEMVRAQLPPEPAGYPMGRRLVEVQLQLERDRAQASTGRAHTG
jgi:hypothetical protein